MFRKIRRAGLAVVLLALAASATAAPASAKTVHDFEAKAPYIVTGHQIAEQEVVFKFGESELVCGASKVNGTVSSSPSEKVVLQFTHEKCTLNGLAATVDSEKCSYEFTGETDESEHAVIHLKCAVENSLRVTVSGCTVEIGSQTLKKGAHYSEGFGDVDAAITTEEGVYSKAGSFCGLIGGLGGDLSIRGSYTLEAYEDKGGVEGSTTKFSTKETTVEN